jgi:hypothetical protein
VLGRIRFGRFQSGVQKFENGPRLGETLLSRRSRNRPGTDHPDYPQNTFHRMNERKVKVIKGTEQQKRLEMKRRTEMAMLKILMETYMPDKVGLVFPNDVKKQLTPDKI